MIKVFALAAALYGAATPLSAQTPAPDSSLAAASGDRANRRFERMDADHDGKVTLSEFTAFSDELFDRIDTGRKSVISKADLDAFTAQRQAEQAGRMTRGRGGGGADGGSRQLNALSARLASGGVVTRGEWDGDAAKQFERLDVDHKGFLTPEDLGRARVRQNREADR